MEIKQAEKQKAVKKGAIEERIARQNTAITMGKTRNRAHTIAKTSSNLVITQKKQKVYKDRLNILPKGDEINA